MPPPEIVTSARAAADYDVAIESWGARLAAAGARICRWAVRNGANLDFQCPAAPAPTKETDR